MKNQILALSLSALLVGHSFLAEAQQIARPPTLGWLEHSSPNPEVLRLIELFRKGLRDLGYVEGKNLAIEYRYADGNLDRLPSLAAELVRLKVDIILTTSGAVARVAKETTKTIPIVMVVTGDPVADGTVASLARPGGNITGLSRSSPSRCEISC